MIDNDMVRDASQTSFIPARRKALGLTQIQLASAIGCEQSTVSRWERGDVTNMELESAVALARQLRMSMDDLCTQLGLLGPDDQKTTVSGNPKRVDAGAPADRKVRAALARYQRVVRERGSKTEIAAARRTLTDAVRAQTVKGKTVNESDIETIVAALIASNENL